MKQGIDFAINAHKHAGYIQAKEEVCVMDNGLEKLLKAYSENQCSSATYHQSV